VLPPVVCVVLVEKVEEVVVVLVRDVELCCCEALVVDGADEVVVVPGMHW
jgi:hypothetical protein